MEAPEGLMGFYVFPSKVRHGKRSVLAYFLIAFTHSTGHALDWDLHKDRNMFWAAEYPYHLNNTWEVSEYLTNKQMNKNNSYHLLGSYYILYMGCSFNLHSNLITHHYLIS